jgi:putative Holliday junction resolvase
MNILSVDFGAKHIGLALADSELKIAMPFRILEFKNKNQLFVELQKIIKAEKVGQIIIGRPIGLNGRITDQTKLTDNFVNSFKRQTEIPLSVFDEKMTSKLASKMLGGKKENHSIAAAIILQDYFSKFFN